MTTGKSGQETVELAVLGAAMMGETTLLILERLEGATMPGLPHQALNEDALVRLLRQLERRGLVYEKMRTYPATQRTSTMGLPELALGRSEVHWWYLTPAGHAAVDDSEQTAPKES
jgi:hypothetical protein